MDPIKEREAEKASGGLGAMSIRIRNRETLDIKKRHLIPDPLNWHSHPQRQRDALTAIFTEIGFVGFVLVRPAAKSGKYYIIDGHERVKHFGDDDLVPCCVLDLSEIEARKLLLSYDAVGFLGEVDGEKLKELQSEVDFKIDDIGEAVRKGLARMPTFSMDNFKPVGIEEQGKLDQKSPISCPHCGGEFVPK